MRTFCGPLPEGTSVCADKPVLLLNCPDDRGIRQFETKAELLRFLASNQVAIDYASNIRVYEFADDRWNEVPVGVSH